MHNNDIESIAKNARKRLIKMHYQANCGHLGGNLSCIDAMITLHHVIMKPDDRFILSKGHSAGALYITLWSLNRLPDEALATFHKDNTLLAGHPPALAIKDILFATGSLGHGLSLATGTALGLRLKGSDGMVFCLTSDGEWQEGSTWEALIFACHHQLTNLTILIDHNNLQGFGSTSDVASMSPLAEKLSGFDIDIQCINGHDLSAIELALSTPVHRCRVIVLETTKGCGISFMENRMEWHYLPLTEEQYLQALVEIDAQ